MRVAAREQGRRALIFAAGRLGQPERIRRLVAPSPDDLIICADGGAAHALTMGIQPDVVLGDLDSLPAPVRAHLEAQGILIRTVPRDKDLTDTHLALTEALARGAEVVVLLGAAGNRWDHTLANLLVLPEYARRAAISVVDDGNILRVLPPGQSLELRGEPGGVVSLLPLSPEVSGIEVEGLRWDPAGRLTWGESRGISNELTGQRARVATQTGWLLVVQAWE